MKWPLTFYTDKTLKDWMGGATRGPIIILRPKYRGDEGIYQHELMHVKQWFALLGVGFALLYLLVPYARALLEAQAYAKQTQYPDRFGNRLTVDSASRKLANEKYKTGLTEDECRKLIQSFLPPTEGT